MAVKNWHPGKIVVAWVIAGFLLWLSNSNRGFRDYDYFLIAMVWGLATLIVTWIWFSGKEERK